MTDPATMDTGDDAPETACAKSSDHSHCQHWYDDTAPCCYCADDVGRVHGDHHPSLDCRVCSDRIADGRTTLAQTYALESDRINLHAGTYSAWRADHPPVPFPAHGDRSEDPGCTICGYAESAHPVRLHGEQHHDFPLDSGRSTDA